MAYLFESIGVLSSLTVFSVGIGGLERANVVAWKFDSRYNDKHRWCTSQSDDTKQAR